MLCPRKQHRVRGPRLRPLSCRPDALSPQTTQSSRTPPEASFMPLRLRREVESFIPERLSAPPRSKLSAMLNSLGGSLGETMLVFTNKKFVSWRLANLDSQSYLGGDLAGLLMSRGGIAIAPWPPLGGLASSLGGLASPILTLRGLTSLTVTLIGLLDTSLPARGGLTSFIVTLGGLISLMTDLRGFTSMVILLGSSTSIAKMALYKEISPTPVLRASQFTLNIHTITPSNTLDCIRMCHCTKLG